MGAPGLTDAVSRRNGGLVALAGATIATTLLAGCAATASPTPSTTTPATSLLLSCGQKKTFAYSSPSGAATTQTSLDVYAPPAGTHGCTGRPIVVWVHGGGWAGGDKSEYMADKVKLFNHAGDLFVSINYRLVDTSLSPPAPRYPVFDQDAADAVAWVLRHAAELGGDPRRIAVLGHSAGGGIVSAIATDPAFLGHDGLSLKAVTCAGSLDGEGYDIVAGETTAPKEFHKMYEDAFGTDPAVLEQASPIRHVRAGAGIPRFFVAIRGHEWRAAQTQAFIDALRAAGVAVTVLDAAALTHADLTELVGAPGDTVLTPALMEFLGGCFAG